MKTILITIYFLLIRQARYFGVAQTPKLSVPAFRIASLNPSLHVPMSKRKTSLGIIFFVSDHQRNLRSNWKNGGNTLLWLLSAKWTGVWRSYSQKIWRKSVTRQINRRNGTHKPDSTIDARTSKTQLCTPQQVKKWVPKIQGHRRMHE